MELAVLNAITDGPKYHFPLLAVQVVIPRINEKIFSIIDLPTAYHQVSLTPETQKLVHFVVGNEQEKNKRGFYGLKALPGFFTRIMTILFAPFTKKNEIITYNDDILIQAETKQTKCSCA